MPNILDAALQAGDGGGICETHVKIQTQLSRGTKKSSDHEKRESRDESDTSETFYSHLKKE